MIALAPLLALVLLPTPGAAQEDASGLEPEIVLLPPGLHFPPGPVAELWARVPADVVARAPLGADAVPRSPLDPRWDEAAVWQRWAELVGAEARAAELGRAGPGETRSVTRDEARAELALFALGQGRGRDAWAHFAACSDPALLAGLAPRFLPGASAELATGPLPAGVVLRPALPPPTPGVIEGRVDRRGYTLEGFQVGDAVLSLTITQEPDGIQVDLEHRSGGPVELQLAIPAPPFLDVRVEYVDWMRQDTVGEPHRVELLPGDERHTLWARFRPRDRSWPGAPAPVDGEAAAPALPTQLGQNGLVLVARAGDPWAPRLTLVSAALGNLLGVPTRLELVPPGAPVPTGPGTIVDLSEGPHRTRRLATLMTLVERHLFAPRKP